MYDRNTDCEPAIDALGTFSWCVDQQIASRIHCEKLQETSLKQVLAGCKTTGMTISEKALSSQDPQSTPQGSERGVPKRTKPSK